MAQSGALIGLPAFALVMAAAPLGLPTLFPLGNFLIGFGGARFGHGTLTATMNRARRHQAGLALRAWGAGSGHCRWAGHGLQRHHPRPGQCRPWGESGALGVIRAGQRLPCRLPAGDRFLLVTIAAAAPLIRRRATKASPAAVEPGLTLKVGSGPTRSADSPIGSGS